MKAEFSNFAKRVGRGSLESDRDLLAIFLAAADVAPLLAGQYYCGEWRIVPDKVSETNAAFTHRGMVFDLRRDPHERVHFSAIPINSFDAIVLVGGSETSLVLRGHVDLKYSTTDPKGRTELIRFAANILGALQVGRASA